jgi:hypothetical protein
MPYLVTWKDRNVTLVTGRTMEQAFKSEHEKNMFITFLESSFGVSDIVCTELSLQDVVVLMEKKDKKMKG